MTRSDIILAATAEAIAEGHVLHVRADRAPASRKLRTDALPAVDLTLGPDARGSFLLVDYSRIRSGLEGRYTTAEAAAGAVRRLLTWGRISALSAALVAVYGPVERTHGHDIDDAQIAANGRRLRIFAESRPPLRGPLFGPGFGPFGR
jgi:hypothetical protein